MKNIISVIILLVLSISFAYGEKIKNHSQVEEWIEQLTAEDSRVKYTAYGELVKLKTQKDIPIFIKALEHPHESVREFAASQLGRIGDKSVGEYLIKAMDDQSDIVRASAALALGNLDYKESCKKLIAGLRDPSHQVRQMSARALGFIKCKEAIEFLKEKLEDPDWYVQSESVMAIKEITGEDFSDKLLYKHPPGFRLEDEHFSKERYEQAMKYFREKYPSFMQRGEEIIHAWISKARENEGKINLSIEEIENLGDELFWSDVIYIGYPNSLTAIEGYILKTQLEIAKLRVDLSKIKVGKTGGKKILEREKESLRKVEEEYREFLREQAWVD